MFRGLILFASFTLLAPGSAFAQSSSATAGTSASAAAQEPGLRGKTPHIMLGVALKSTTATGEGTGNSLQPTFIWRFKSRTPRADDRFAFAYRLGSYHSELSSGIAGTTYNLGRAKFKPFMVGADYKMPRGKWSWAAGVTAGYSFNSLQTPANFRDRITAATGTTDIAMDISNSFAMSPRVKGWYDLNRRMALMVESSYTFDRPELRIRTGGLDSSRRLNADAFVAKVGVVYQVW